MTPPSRAHRTPSGVRRITQPGSPVVGRSLRIRRYWRLTGTVTSRTTTAGEVHLCLLDALAKDTAD